jgi:single-strand DNA-binding protein
MSINKVILTGRLGKDPDLRYTPSGKAVATFSLAVTDNFNREVTHWLNCVVWGKSAEHCANYLSKGSHVAIDGRIQNRSYENKEGRKVSVTEIVADRVEFLDSKGKSDKPADGWDDIGRDIQIDDDDPPF